MKKLLFAVGGKPWANDDLETLQAETYAALSATISAAPAMVLSGCAVTVTGPNVGDIGPGMIWLQGEVHHYAGAAQVQLPAEVVAGAVATSDPRAYQTGGTLDCMSELELITQPGGTAPAGTELIAFVAGPVQTYAKWLESQTRTIGEVQWLTRHNAQQYDADGKGWADLASAGWHLCNGIGGTADLRERFIVGMGAGPDYDAPRKVGGEARVTLSTDEMPQHSHGMQQAGAHTHGLRYNGDRDSGGSGRQPLNNGGSTMQTESAGAHTHTIDNAGNSQSHENRPPFFVLVAREWVGL